VEEARAALREKQEKLAERLVSLRAQCERKAWLEGQRKKTEILLEEAEDTAKRAEEQRNRLQAALESKKSEEEALRGTLAFPSAEEAQKALAAWKAELRAIKESLEQAEQAHRSCENDLSAAKAVLAGSAAELDSQAARERGSAARICGEARCGGIRFGRGLSCRAAPGGAGRRAPSGPGIVPRRMRPRARDGGQAGTDHCRGSSRKTSARCGRCSYRHRPGKRKPTRRCAEFRCGWTGTAGARGQLKRSLEQRAKLNKAYESALDLDRTANGSLPGRQRLNFEQFVQAAYFNRILEQANLRLSEMTNGRYELRRREEATDLRVRFGLDLDVMDYYTGCPRDVKIAFRRGIVQGVPRARPRPFGRGAVRFGRRADRNDVH
jgi:exonuclease SbcC